jgi:hypothetical protein
MLKHITCLVGGHRPDKNRVRHDGQDYVAPCRGCGQLMYKTRMGERPWKLDDGVRAYSPSGRDRALFRER